LRNDGVSIRRLNNAPHHEWKHRGAKRNEVQIAGETRAEEAADGNRALPK
jgi:hypothetical protein